MKVCTVCRVEKPLSNFYLDKRGAKARYGRCKPCHHAKVAEYKRRNPAKARAWDSKEKHSRLLRKYGLTTVAYSALLAKQGTRCAICRLPSGRSLDVDHDHETGTVRGLLCRHCNLAIGQFNHDPVRLDAAAKYLRAATYEPVGESA